MTLFPTVEHLTPHDLVTYFRCPYEMELVHTEHEGRLRGVEVAPRTPLDVVPLRHSPLPSPPIAGLRVTEGRMDVGFDDRLIYQDEGEPDLPLLFPPDRIRLDPRFVAPHSTLVDAAWGFAGRPDLVIERPDGSLVPVECKSTHLFTGEHAVHGRLFDTLQAISECRLVESAFGRRPATGIVYYGDLAGDGAREGWVEIPYGVAEEAWLRMALTMIREDRERAPVPSVTTCSACEPNGEGRCRYAAARFEGSRRSSGAIHGLAPASLGH